MINCNLRMKLKTSKTFSKQPKTKISNTNSKEINQETKQKRGLIHTFIGRERKAGRKIKK